MAANKPTTKRNKGKTSARRNATDRASRRGVAAAGRRTPAGNPAVNQSRFPRETPPTG